MSNNTIETLKFSLLDRPQQIQKLHEKEWDILVIGGGITGAGVAREAVIRGLSVALLDQNDFAFGTSSRSTKLAHGGIRYLAQFRLGLVREAAKERNWLREEALPHMTRPTRFLYPILQEGQIDGHDLPKSRGYRPVRFVSFLYDLLCGFKSYASGRGIKNIGEIHTLEPLLDHSRLKSAVTWYDSNIDDARLVIETVKEAIWRGNAVALNYIRITGFTQDPSGRINGVHVVDETHPHKNKMLIRGRVIVNTTGVWADQLLAINRETHENILRPTKGVHLAYHRKDIPINDTFALNSIDDGRFFFVIRRNEWVIVGTTDTDYNENLTHPTCTRTDADYLRNTVKVIFPKAQIQDDKILGTYAGLRPLIAETGKTESKVSRKHVILERNDGLFSLLGGKLTTFRKMAEDLFLAHIKKVQKGIGLPKFSLKKNLSKTAYAITLRKDEWEALPEVRRSTLHHRILHHLYEQYGRGGQLILRLIEQNPELARRILDKPNYPVEVAPWVIAEVAYVVRHEAPVHLEDVLCRRMEISWLVRPEYQGHIAATTASVMGEILGWSKNQIKNEITSYLEYVKSNSFFYEGEIPVPRIN